MFNIYYEHNHCQFEQLKHLSHEYLPLEVLTQLHKFGDTEVNVVTDGDTQKLNTEWPVIVPIDYQSTGLSYESREQSETVVSWLGEAVEHFLENVCEKLHKYNLVILLYTSSEPYFHDNHYFVSKLAQKHHKCKFVISGSGETAPAFCETLQYMQKCKNIKIVGKLWYLDRVHYNMKIKDVIENRQLHHERHFRPSEDEPPEHIPSYMVCPNKFLLTMRNPRSHRLIMSTLLERDSLGPVRYSRYWSMSPGHLQQMNNSPTLSSEFPYQVDLITNAIQRILREDVDDTFVRDMLDVLMKPPHKLDMPDASDPGHPPKWLYDNICLAVIASGEGEGYGYVDEKQLIPMWYKKPFISFGCAGVNEELEKIGFDVYRRVFDLSYANKPTVLERVRGCYDLMKEIDQYSEEKIYEIFSVQCPPIAQHNYLHATTGNFRILSNNHFFKEIADVCN